ncbi:Ent-kaurene oxidase [Rhypophila decipiens]
MSSNGFATTVAEQYMAMKSAIGPLRVSWPELFILFLRRTMYNINQIWLESAIFPKVLAITATIVVLAILWDWLVQLPVFSTLQRRGIPLLRLPKHPILSLEKWNYEALMKEGVQQFPRRDTPYIIRSTGLEFVIFPSACFDELKRLPHTQASLVEWQHTTAFTGWRLFGIDQSPMYKMISTDLARASSLHTQKRHQHTREAVERTFGSMSHKGWTKLPIYSSLAEAVTATNSAGLVPNEEKTTGNLARNPRWLQSLQTLPMLVLLAYAILYVIPRPLRPLFANFAFVPAKYTAWSMKQLLMPSLRREFDEYYSGRGKADSKTTKQNGNGGAKSDKYQSVTITAWLLNRYREQQNDRVPAIDTVADDYVRTVYFANPSTSATIYNIFIELITRPALMEELREEVDQVLGITRDEYKATENPGLLSHADLQKLHRLDSFMREAVRIRQFIHLAACRKTVKPLQLSVGPLIPAGTLICVDAYHINRSPDFYQEPGPDVFDAMRSYRKRFHAPSSSSGSTTKTSSSSQSTTFASFGPDVTHWGGGPQGCPGREFATDTIKLILVEVLSRYEVQFVGETPPKKYFMPNGSVAPDMWASMLVRGRSTDEAKEE